MAHDANQVLSVLEASARGGDQLLAAGALQELGWFTSQEGYAFFEAESKESVLGMVQGFFPYYTSDVREVVPWERGKEAILQSASPAAAR